MITLFLLAAATPIFAQPAPECAGFCADAKAILAAREQGFRTILTGRKTEDGKNMGVSLLPKGASTCSVVRTTDNPPALSYICTFAGITMAVFDENIRQIKKALPPGVEIAGGQGTNIFVARQPTVSQMPLISLQHNDKNVMTLTSSAGPETAAAETPTPAPAPAAASAPAPAPSSAPAPAPAAAPAPAPEQAGPDDNALKALAVRRAGKALPEAAHAELVKGSHAMQTATEAADYSRAVAHYEAALKIAPWSAEAWLGAAKAQEQLKNPGAAARAYSHYLLVAPKAADARQIQDHVYELQDAAEKAHFGN